MFELAGKSSKKINRKVCKGDITKTKFIVFVPLLPPLRLNYF